MMALHDTKAETLDFWLTDLFQLFFIKTLLMVGTMSNYSYITVDSQPKTSLKQQNESTSA